MGIHHKKQSRFRVPHPRRAIAPGVSGEGLAKFAVFLDEFVGTVAAGSVDGTLSSDGKAKRNVTDTENKLSINNELTLAGGLAAPAWGDPMITWSTLGDGAFVTAPCAGALWAITLDGAGSTRFGFASSVGGTVPTDPSIESSSGLIRKRPGSDVLANPGYGVEAHVMQYSRNSTNGYIWFVHQSGKQWKLLYVDPTSALISGVDAFIKFCNYNQALSFSRVALLDLASKYDPDFAEITDTETNPSTGTGFTTGPNCHVNFTFTYEDGKYVYVQHRRTDSTHYLRSAALTTGDLDLRYNNGAGLTIVRTVSGIFSDGVPYEIDVVAEGYSQKIYVDKVLKIDEVVSEAPLTGNSGYVQHNLVSNDLVIEVHPYPNLGGICVDRIICPQENETGTMFDDTMVNIRGIRV